MYILVKGTVTIPNTGTLAAPNNRKNIIIKACAPFTNCISKINNKQIDDAKYIELVISMYNFMEYNNNYWKVLGILW